MGKYFTAFAFLLCTLLGQAQEQEPKQGHGTIKGRVFSADGQPAAFIPVGVKGSFKGTSTDDNGYFQFSLPEGKHILLIQFLGHEPEEEEIEVKVGETVQVPDFKLRESAKELQEVEIMGKTEVQELKESEFAVNSIDTKPFANTTADLNQVLNRSIGVKVRESGGVGSDYNFSINGLSGKSIKYFIDGIPMEVLGSSMTLNNIPVNLAERLEVYKGVVPVHLGADAMGGAVNIVTNQKVKNYLDASYSYGSFNTHRAALTGQFTHQKTGLVLRSNVFYNFSNNNYVMKGVEVWDEAEYKYLKKDLRRFHDKYESGMGQLEAGFLNKKWADVFFVGISYSASQQDIQTGTRQDIPFGDAIKKGYAYSGSLRWKKSNLFVKGLSLSTFLSRSFDTYATVDTAANAYAWDGTYVKGNKYEMGGVKAITNVTRPKTFARVNLSHEWNDRHSVNLNYTLDHVQNQVYNEVLTDKDNMPGMISKHILGAAYQQHLFSKRLSNTFFGKYYGLGLEMPKAVSSTGELTKSKNLLHNYGYGIATRYKIGAALGAKASFEHAYRLQEVEEVFGNGYTVITNPNLRPEKSDNVNVGLYYDRRWSKHKLFLESAAFYRKAEDFIYQVIYSTYVDVRRYENTSKVKVSGLEGEIRYDYDHLVNFMINASYQNAINNTRYALGTKGVPEATYLNKIPNQPWLFGNANLGIGKNDVLRKNTRLQFNWNTQYVHWFYLTWEAFGSKEDKNKVPSQWIHNASLSYSFAKGKYNISLECRNLTDALAYDNFMLQKPGRSFFAKLRYFIH